MSDKGVKPVSEGIQRQFYQLLSSEPYWYLFKIFGRVERFAQEASGFGVLTFRVEMRDGKVVRLVCEREEESIMPNQSAQPDR